MWAVPLAYLPQEKWRGATNQTAGRPGAGFEAWLHSPFDLHGREADAVSFPEHLVGRGWQAVDPDQIVFGLAVRHPLTEQQLHRGVFVHFDVVSKAAVELSTDLAVRTRLQNRT